MKRTPPILRALVLLPLSTLLGAFFALIPHAQFNLGFVMPLPALIGAAVGAILTPCLWKPIRGRGAPLFLFLIISGTTLATFAGGALVGEPTGSLGFSIAAYVGLAFFCDWLRIRLDPQHPPWSCQRCGYNRSGLPPDAICPECGHAVGAKP